MEIGLDRVAHILAIAGIGKNNSNPKAASFYLTKREISVTFANYVKSQINVNVAGVLFGRNIFKYVSVYTYITGSSEDDSNVKEVLSYYYRDMGNAMINNTESLIIHINPILKEGDASVNKDYLTRSKDIDRIVYEEDPIVQEKLIKECSYSKIFWCISNKKEYEIKKYNFAVASLLLEAIHKEDIPNITI